MRSLASSPTTAFRERCAGGLALAVVLAAVQGWQQASGQVATQTAVNSLPAPDPLRGATATIVLWPDGAPGAVGTEPRDRPTLSVFDIKTPASRPRTAVLVLPGGAYVGLATDHEGRQVAEWLNRRDVVAFVLTYRLAPRYRYPAPFDDATHAMRYIRSHAAQFNLDRARIGIWGFSAGGHLASLVGTHFDEGDAAAPQPIDRASSRPDFMVLAYPVIEPI